MGIVDRLRQGKHLRTLRSVATASPEALAEAREALVEMGERAIPPLLEVLAVDGSRHAAGEVLQRLLTPDTLPDFVQALSSPDRGMRAGVREVLERGSRYDPKDLLPYLSEKSVPKAPLEAVLRARVAELHAGDLLLALSDLERDARAIAFRLIEETADASIAPEVTALLDHKDWWIRMNMAKLLARIPGDSTEKALSRVLTDRNKAVRLQAVKSLHALEGKLAIPYLANVLRDGDLTVQAAAIDALIAIDDPGAVAYLIEVLADESEHARRGAVEVLNEVATTEAIHDLVRALRDADWWVRVRAADALGTLGGEKVVDAVLGLLTDSDVHIRRYAVEILNTVPDERAVDPLIEALQDGDWWVRERSIDALARTRAARAVRPLCDLMQRDSEAAPLCARALGEIADIEATADLVRILTGRSSVEVRREVVEALKKIEKIGLPPKLQPKVEEALREEGIRVEKTRLQPMEVRPHAGAAALPFESVEASNPIERDEHGPAPEHPNARRTVRAEQIEEGQLLLERYRVVRKIGAGGFSTVFLVEDIAVDDRLILKLLSYHLTLDESSMARFVQELKLARKISHPNVIRIHDLLELGEARAISMEYFPGRDLGRILDDIGKLGADRGVHICRQICEGLTAAHAAGIIHRDIKPANILVGDDDSVKIVDFGLAAASRDAENRLTRTGHLVGTPHYMAPELIRGEDVDARTDLYSFGVMMYEMFAGVLPYDGDNPMNVLFRHLDGDAKPLTEHADIPAGLASIVTRTMALAPADRPQTATELLDELSALQA